MLGGHIHLPFTLPLHGLARRLCVVQAGTAVSSRTRPGVPNSVNVLRWGHAADAVEPDIAAALATGPHCLVERWDFCASRQAFERSTVTAVQPERANAPG